jgi:fatty-acyl-CoA synthase
MAEISQLPIAHLISQNTLAVRYNNLIEMLEKAATRNRPAITFLDRDNNENHKTYDELLEGARVVATYLRNRGLKRGDKVILLLLTSEHFTDSFFGTILAGGVPVPCSPPMTFGDINKYLNNLSHIVSSSEARFLITFPRIIKVIGNILAENNNLRELILAKDITRETPLNPGFPSIDNNDPAFFQYTSGSTGMPKGVVLTHRALLSNMHGIVQGINCGEKDSCVSWLPLFHDMGLIGSMLTALYAETHLYTMLPESFVMNPVSWLQNITKYGATVAVAPNFAYHLCASRIGKEQLNSINLRSLRVALNGAEPIDLRTLKIFEDKFGPCGYRNTVSFPVYGMAENCLAATFPTLDSRFEVEPIDRVQMEVEGVARQAHRDDPFPFQAVSVGSPLAGQEVAIKSNGGFAFECEVGEILVKSPSLMQGYYHNEEETNRVLKNGWLHTGDLGFIHRGRLFITGRAKEMIIKRGRNYYPYDIERAASNIPGVRKGCLAAFSIPNPDQGTEDLVVVVESHETDQTARKQIEQRISGEILSSVGIKPDQVRLVPPRSIPKTSSGKLQRLLCRQYYLNGTLVKDSSDRWITPMRTLVSSFIGHQRFRMRARNS